MKMFRKMIYYESLKHFQKKTMIKLNLAWHAKYKLASSSFFDVSKVANLVHRLQICYKQTSP